MLVNKKSYSKQQKNPTIDSCMAYKSALAWHEINYTKNDISGAIPYIRSYNSALAGNMNRAREVFSAVRTIGGWQDNYYHYLILVDDSDSKSSDLRVTMRFRMMGDVDETFYIGGLDANKRLSKISKIYSSMPLYFEGALRETVEMNLRFPGQYYDKATGLHYNLNRYYNPMLGRYMEADPIGMDGGWNPYAYAGNDPVNNVDPEGLMEVRNEPIRTGIGVQSSYHFKFNPLSENGAKSATKILFQIAKKIDRFQTLVDFITADPVGPKSTNTPSNMIEVGLLDAKLDKIYNEKYKKSEISGLKREQAELFLKDAFSLYPDEMKKHYDIPKDLLNQADVNAMNAPFTLNPPPKIEVEKY